MTRPTGQCVKKQINHSQGPILRHLFPLSDIAEVPFVRMKQCACPNILLADNVALEQTFGLVLSHLGAILYSMTMKLSTGNMS